MRTAASIKKTLCSCVAYCFALWRRRWPSAGAAHVRTAVERPSRVPRGVSPPARTAAAASRAPLRLEEPPLALWQILFQFTRFSDFATQ